MKTAIMIVVLFLGLVAAISCSRTRLNPQEFTGPTVDVPQFAVAIKLSPKAEERLHDLHETIKVIAYFDGDALPGQGKYNPPMRDVYLGMSQQAVDEAYVARFEHVKVPKSDWDRLAGKDFFVTINTVSARKVAANNLLDCADPISRKLTTMKGKTTGVQCWLIGEPNAVAPDQNRIGAAAFSKVGHDAPTK